MFSILINALPYSIHSSPKGYQEFPSFSSNKKLLFLMENNVENGKNANHSVI